MDSSNWNHPTWKNGWLKLMLQKKLILLKNWMTSRYSSLQTKWHTTLKNGRQQVARWKKYIVFKAISTPKKQLFGESNCSKRCPCKCKCLQFLFWKCTILKLQLRGHVSESVTGPWKPNVPGPTLAVSYVQRRALCCCRLMFKCLRSK